ncbi:MAG: ABC transporter permease subunit [Planctomycetota bacterium]
MNRNLLLFTLRRSLTGTVLTGAALMVFEFLLVLFYTEARPDQNLEHLVDLIPPAFRTFLGAEYLGLFSVRGFLAFGFVHPVVLLLLGASAVALGSRCVAGGIGDHTVDLLLAQPLRRHEILFSQVGVGLFPALVLPLGMWAGQQLGVAAWSLPGEVSAAPFLLAAVNAAALYLALLGIAVVCSAVTSRRGHAVSCAVGVLASALFLRLAAQIWHAFELPGKLSPFTYYIPSKVVLEERLPAGDVTALLVTLLALLGASTLAFAHRDIR